MAPAAGMPAALPALAVLFAPDSSRAVKLFSFGHGIPQFLQLFGRGLQGRLTRHFRLGLCFKGNALGIPHLRKLSYGDICLAHAIE